MAWTTYQLGLAFMMLITGSINTLSTKWADTSTAVGVDGGAPRVFDHPFLQAVGMFMGELTCLLVFHIMRVFHTRRNTLDQMDVGNQHFNPLIFLPAAMLDMLGTSTMYVGLNLTFASSFQMLRGAVMIFTALLSVIFLGRKIHSHMWLGMFTVLIGLVTVGVSDIVFGNDDKSDKNGIIAGDLLIILAQVITASQMVYEEKFVTRHNVPALQAVGWEGFFGFFVLGILLIPMYYLKPGHPFSNDPDGRMENVLDAFIQMKNNHIIIIATIGNIVSIAFFNFSGISVTKQLSATTRMVLDSCRTLIIWIVSLAVKWQPFLWNSFLVQATGFIFLIFGMFIYNELVCGPYLRRRGILRPLPEPPISEQRQGINSGDDERQPLIQPPEESGRSQSPLYS